jgi:hypothetical protein
MPILNIKRARFTVTERADGYALGTVEILGIPMHAQFIRVREENGEQVCDGSSDEAIQNWIAASSLYDCAWKTIKLSELAGDWVCLIHPHAK